VKLPGKRFYVKRPADLIVKEGVWEVGRVPTFAFLGQEMTRVTVAGLHKLFEPGVQALGFELVDVEYAADGGRNVLRVYIDRPDGITVDDCAKVSRQVSAVLDVEDPIPEGYTLEVSSPGLDRPLVKRADFERFAGQDVKVRMREAVSGRRNFKGMLVGVEGDAIVVNVDQERFSLPIARIERARLVPQW